MRKVLVYRTAAMFGGTAMGQGLYFLVSIYFLSFDPTTIGEIGSGYGLAIIALMIVDWGGVVTQRQIAESYSPKSVALAFVAVRVIPLIVVLLLILLGVTYGYPTKPISLFLLGSAPGIVISMLNMTGFLDVIDEKASHAYLQGAPAVLLSVYLLLDHRPSPLLCGVAFSIGCASMIAFQVVRSFAAVKSRLYVAETQLVPLGPLLADGAHVLVFNLPGQVVSRIVPAALVIGGASGIAAIYNALKQAQGLLNQAVTLLRRVEYNYALAAIRAGSGFFVNVRAQKLSLAAGVAFGTLGMLGLSIFASSLGFSGSMLVVFYAQSLVWLVTSSYFFKLQLVGGNKLQGLYGGLFTAIFFASFYYLKPSAIERIVFVEIASSMISFLMVFAFLRMVRN